MKCFCEFDLFQWLPWWLHSDTFRKRFFFPAASEFTSFHCLTWNDMFAMQILVPQIHQTVGSRQDLYRQTGCWVQHYLLGQFKKIFRTSKTRTLMRQWEKRWTWRHKDTINIKQEVLQKSSRIEQERPDNAIQTQREGKKQINTCQKQNHGNSPLL